MVKRTFLIVFMIILAFASLPGFTFAGGDTGTYRIIKYNVTLTPKKDGTTRIEYYQKWVVTDGHIPWITVGVANNDYDVVGSGLAAAHASPKNSGQESMVRLDLDRDYQPGETFEIQFTINQRHLFQKANDRYTISFTPGWYDRASIDSLDIHLNLPCNISETTSQPAPTHQSGNVKTWNGIKLNESGRFPITFSFPKLYAPNAAVGIGHDNTNTETSSVVFPIVIVVFLVISYFVKKSLGIGEYSGGRLYRGGGGGGSCYVSSCACACAGCACACACAGGGGAGCSRKNEHVCPVCKERNTKPAIELL